MDAHTVMEEWEPSPFDGGFGGLKELQSRGFSGAVETGATWLFLRDGEPLAVVSNLETEPNRGDIDAFEGATGTAHGTSNPATASLAAMLALDGEVRGQYFSDDTPLSMVDETLSEGGFTGYVELSENVLSGDYYVVYEDGEAAHLGYVGSSNRLLTEDEAESKAENEVGIYSVVAVRFDDIEVPGPEPQSTTATAAPTNGGPSTEPEADDSTEAETEPESPGGIEEEAESEPEFDSAFNTAEDSAESPESVSGSESVLNGVSEDDSIETATEVADADAETAVGESTEPKPAVQEIDNETEPTDQQPDDETPTVGAESDDSKVTTEPKPESVSDTDEESEPQPEPESNGESKTPPSDATTVPETRLEELREEYEERLEELREELSSLRTERDRLRERVRTLESADDGPSGGRALSPAEALAETSLFVREGSRGEATLEDAHAGQADSDSLRRNLRIEHHTQFDADGVTVDGEPFESWLKSSAAYEFVEWLVFELMFEIRAAGGESGMRHLYDALPNLDRIGFQETVTVGKAEGGEEGREIAFDVVARNRMGDPLAIATIDEGRDPTRAGTVEPLVVDGSDVCEAHESLVAAFAVTSSFFEPDALGAAREATSSSLLSREKYRGYVKLARKNGFHLCLVEAREGSYYLTMPEL